MGKIKVRELAEKLGIKSAELLEKLKKDGIDVKTNLSSIEESIANKYLLKFGKASDEKKDEKKSEQMHIIRRNIRVINTDGQKSEVEQITTNIAGDIKKSKTTIDGKKSEDYSKDGLGVVKPRGNYDRRNKNTGNRAANVIITRNGKPVEKISSVEKKDVKEVKSENAVDTPARVEEKVEVEKKVMDKKIDNNMNQEIKKDYRKNSNNGNFEKNQGNSNFNRQRNQNENYDKQSNYKNRRNNYDSTQNGNINRGFKNRQDDKNRTSTANSSSGEYSNNYNKNRNYNNYKKDGSAVNSTKPFNRPYNRNNNGQEQRQNYNNRPNGNFRNNRPNTDNTSYQVNKFIKQSSNVVPEQKETREYSNINIDKKKYNEKNISSNENKKEKLDKNKLREKHSRVATSKLKGMEIDSDGLLDLYERDTDTFKKSSKKAKKSKTELKQTKIIPMTEVKLPEVMTVKEFAEAIKKQASEVIKKLFGLGIMATVNQDIDFDTAYLIASDFGINAQKEVKVTEEDILFDDSEDSEEDLVPRPPIVVVMGHVDHGKTSLLDRLRSSNVVSGEAGGITQHIGAYKVEIKGREICFLDTPGHEAFTAMRARGAQVTDIAVIVVAADDGIKPQTIEAIDHAKAAGVSIIVAINKIDKPTANIDRVKQELLEIGLVPEEWGGDTICVPISALTGQGIDNLLEMILLVADMKDLKANPNKQAKGTVLEARLDKTKGTVVSMLIQRGELNIGDTIVVGDMVSKIRAMKDDKGRKVKSAGPSTPVEVLGLSHVPQTGDIFYEVDDEKTAKHLIEKRKAEARTKLIKQGSKVTLDDLFGQIKEGKIKELNIIIKADVQGSVEALKDSLLKLSNDEVRVRVLHASTGGIKESDVTLASVSNAIIIGFNVRPESIAASQAEKEKVDMRLYNVIYDAINDVETALKGMIPKKYKEVMLGTAEIRKIFKITGVGIVAGCYVKSGKIVRNQMVRVVRDNIVILAVKIDNLKREKDEVKEVAEGYECGIKLEKFSEIKEGDILECYELVEEK